MKTLIFILALCLAVGCAGKDKEAANTKPNGVLFGEPVSIRYDSLLTDTFGIVSGESLNVRFGPDPVKDPCAYKTFRQEQDAMAFVYDHIPIPPDTLGDPCHLLKTKTPKP
jgi:hypothetical protein